MREHESHELDALIEAALGSETLLPVPLTLHRKVEERLRIAQLRERECVRFRYSMTSLVVLSCAVLGLVGALITFSHLGLLVDNGVSGGRGQYDSVVNYVMQSFEGYSGAYSLIVSMGLACGTLLLGLIPLKKYLGTN